MAPSIRIAAILLLLAPCSGSSVATETPDTAQISFDATVQMSGTTVAAGIGYGWGHGKLTYHGDEHAFCVHGLEVGDLGVAHLHAEGLVFHLNHLQDFAGKYYAGSMGVAIVGGESAALLKNQHGVTMQLETKEKGLRFNIAASGLRISLARNGRCGS
jgi:hypothetical protein